MKSATAYRKKDGIYLHAHARTTSGLRIAIAPFMRIDQGESDSSIGEVVIAVLNASMIAIVPHPKQDEWTKVFAPMLTLAGVKSLSAFESDAVCCGLEVKEGRLRVIPHIKLGKNKAYHGQNSESISLPFDSSAGAIGTALEEGFGRCESKARDGR